MRELLEELCADIIIAASIRAGDARAEVDATEMTVDDMIEFILNQ